MHIVMHRISVDRDDEEAFVERFKKYQGLVGQSSRFRNPVLRPIDDSGHHDVAGSSDLLRTDASRAFHVMHAHAGATPQGMFAGVMCWRPSASPATAMPDMAAAS